MSDYISREEAYAIAKRIVDALDTTPRVLLGRTILDFIDDIPAADVKPLVKSKWADSRVSFYRGCPECGAFVRANLDEVFLRDFPSAVGRLNYCPNCGARMDGES